MLPSVPLFIAAFFLGCDCAPDVCGRLDACADQVSVLPYLTTVTADVGERQAFDEFSLLQSRRSAPTSEHTLRTPKTDAPNFVRDGTVADDVRTWWQNTEQGLSLIAESKLAHEMWMRWKTIQQGPVLTGDGRSATDTETFWQMVQQDSWRGSCQAAGILGILVFVIIAWFLFASASSVQADQETTVDVKMTESESQDEFSEPISVFRWSMMTLVMYIYALINTSMALFVLPVESRRMHPGSGGSIWVAVCIAVCGVAQLINPIAGKLSDRHVSPLGRRRPFIFLGTVIAIVGFLGLWVASIYSRPLAYQASLLFLEIGLNFAFSAQCGLPSDIQDEHFASDFEEETTEEQLAARGTSSGVVALMSMLGSLSAVVLMALTRHMAVQVQYPIYIIGLTLCCALVCCFALEHPAHASPQQQILTWSEVKGGFMIDTDEDGDFFWVCFGRMCYYVVTSTLVFQMYYLEDMLEMEDEVDRKLSIFIMVFIAQGIGLVCSVPFGKSSNTLGRKTLIYCACVVMSLASVCQMLAPKIGTRGSWPMVVASAVLAGLGNSAYLSVDYALALDCMPKGKTTAEAFGLWGIAGFAGSTIGPLLGGALLHFTAVASGGRVGQAHYTYVGYCCLFLSLGIVANVFVAFCTTKILMAN